ncbi:PrsW family intramembrane metalloprotease [Cellulomonas shaoxiangyii]|uniref:PrsW family intramembrane metalloprotease n=2 Tax=Cellulomonas shaoxiangyii TaxID=2566013 RepID=A0A4P7SQW9_9CELL|nr:PrsW family intramembrane metalloprotease [Cellulomonas shaoxiangyii]TGY84849.1 PrsW family intramembrane metalloprotease [Cellulomonas shaoxiangyii]
MPTQWAGGRGRSAGATVVAAVGIALAGLAALAGIAFVMLEVGMGPGLTGTLLALVPLALVLAGVRWLDRWEPEPRGALVFALLWGAGVAVLVSAVVNDLAAWTVANATGSLDAGVMAAAVVSAPIVEESAKGAGVLLLFLTRRRYFDGVVDGIVYAGVVAAGFAFTENILYFGRAGGALAETFVLRGLATPFAHLLFTACIGAALGLAARSRSRGAIWWLLPLGLLAAMVAHSLWNLTSILAGGSYIGIYLLVQVPVFLGVVGIALWLRGKERQVVEVRLTEYARAGWFAPHEVQMLSSLRLRRAAVAWAGRVGGPVAAEAMRDFQRRATTLAFRRQLAVNGRADLRTHGLDERETLASLTADRGRVLASAGTL